MTQPRPTAEELLDAVRAFLADDVLPGLDGRLRFHARVAVNVLDTVGRELRDGPGADAAERAGLLALLAAAPAPPEADAGERARSGGAADERDGSSRAADGAGDRAVDPDVDALSRALAARIRDGDVAIDDPDLLTHLVATARADVAIANPRHLGDPETPSP